MLSSEEDDMEEFEWKTGEALSFIEKFWELPGSERNITTRDSKKLWFLFSCTGCSYNSLPSARTQNRCFPSDKTKQMKETNNQKPKNK